MDMQTDAIVIGAGVVGLAVARALAQSGVETVLIERRRHIGEETSSRNSEVIHAGIYYPPGSLKATACVRGKELLYDFLATRNIPHRRCGKLIVARTAADEDKLTRIRERATVCGVTDLEMLDRGELRDLEAEVEGQLALLSPSTGIVDSHQLMLALQGEFEAAGGMLALDSPLEGGALDKKGLHRLVIGGQTPAEIGSRIVVNAAGLYARDVLDLLVGSGEQMQAPAQYFAKGHYYSYPGKAPFQRLVYPLPEAGGLGVHATLDLAGQVRFGPDVRWIERIDYAFDESGRSEFVDAIRGYFPGLEETRLQPGYTGIRPRVVGPGQPAADFRLLLPDDHGIRGFCSLHGIESPGLTAALAIAERVAEALEML